MPKLKESPAQHMNRRFMAALRYGQELRGERDADTAKIVMPQGPRTFYRRVKEPEKFSVENVRVIAQRYFNDRQLCEAFGVEYHGRTPE